MAGLLAIAAVAYVAFTANSGLPFESTYEVTVDVPNADRLIDTDEVSINGIRVGRVAAVDAVPGSARTGPHARVRLQLDGGTDPLPVDTAVKVRPASVLGSSYVDLAPGNSSRTVPSGGRLPLANADRAVQITDLLNLFERSTARHIQRTIGELGVGVAGRGPAINTTLGELEDALGPLRRVSAAAAAPRARLDRFLSSFASAADALGPARRDLAGLMTGGAQTFDAFARERAALGQTITGLPPAEAATTAALTNLQPALDGLAVLAEDLRPAGPVLRPALGRAERALRAGERPLRALPRLSRNLGRTLVTLEAVARRPTTGGALRKLRELFDAGNPFLAALAPAQVHCNVIPLWARIGDTFGTIGFGNGPALVNIMFTTAGADREALQNAKPSSNAAINFVPNTGARECEGGNEPYEGRQALDNPPTTEPNETLDTAAPADATERAREAGLLETMGGPR